MAYNGSVELISGIKQKNNGSFPLVDASAVYIDDNTRLDNALSGKTIRADITQTLSTTDKARARSNIGVSISISGNTLILNG